MANTLVFNNGDHADTRPVVVVRSPQHRLDYVVFLQRTSTCFHLPGVDHAPDSALGLERPGKWIFAYQRTVRADEFEDHRFECKGELDADFLPRLLGEWEAQ